MEVCVKGTSVFCSQKTGRVFPLMHHHVCGLQLSASLYWGPTLREFNFCWRFDCGSNLMLELVFSVAGSFVVAIVTVNSGKVLKDLMIWFPISGLGEMNVYSIVQFLVLKYWVVEPPAWSCCSNVPEVIWSEAHQAFTLWTPWIYMS